MLLGYVRISSKDQNETRQILKMRELGIEERFIFLDKASGKDFDREQYQAMKRIIREGDLIYLDSLDRLGRSYDGVIEEWKYITRTLNADIVTLDNASLFDSRKFREMGDIGKLMEDQFLSLLAYVAEQERKKIKQRQAEGIAVAKAEGKHLGRPVATIDAKKFKEIYKTWKTGEITAVQASKGLGLSKPTFYRRVQELEKATLL
jgi:DNA invertase Pin-like site-specific DNA recombinase